MTGQQHVALGSLDMQRAIAESLSISMSPKSVRDQFRASVLKLLNEQVVREARIVALPEYCIPAWLADDCVALLRAQSERDRIGRVVALGSHIDERGYNVCPIAIAKDGKVEVYRYTKIFKSSVEKKLGAIRVGDAPFLFRTGVGNIMVLVCSDIRNTESWLERVSADVDVIVLPTFHDGDPESMTNALGVFIESGRTIVLANGATRGALDAVAPRQRRQGGRRGSAGERLASFVHGRIEGERQRRTARTGGIWRFGTRFGIAWERLCVEVDLVRMDQERAGDRVKGGAFPLHYGAWHSDQRRKASRVIVDEPRIREVLQAQIDTTVGGDIERWVTIDEVTKKVFWTEK
jgi:hypothetical protein